MKRQKDFHTDLATELALLRKILVIFGIVFGSIFLGKSLAQTVTGPFIMIGAWFMVWLLIKRPDLFLYLGLFFFYRALNIVDVDTFGRLPGFFRLKDIFLLLLIVRLFADIALGQPWPKIPKGAVRTMLLFFLGWIAFQMFRTTVLVGEEPVLMFRAARKFLSYGIPFLVFYYIRTEQQWRQLLLFVFGLAVLTFILAVFSAMGFHFTLGGNATYGAYYDGVFKYYSPGESIVYVLFILSVWMYCTNPDRFKLILVGFMATACMMFVFRARLAGLTLGVILSALLAPKIVRQRAFLTGIVVVLVLTISLIVFPVIASLGGSEVAGNYVASLVEYFESARRGFANRDTGDILIREYFVAERMPLIREHPLVGVGFISPFGEVGWAMFRKGAMPIGHVDVGWIDALIQLGGVGSIILLILIFSAAKSALNLLRRYRLPHMDQAICLSLISFSVLMLVSVYSFSYPTEESAMITYALLLSRLLTIQKRVEEEDEEEREVRKAVVSAKGVPRRPHIPFA